MLSSQPLTLHLESLWQMAGSELPVPPPDPELWMEGCCFSHSSGYSLRKNLVSQRLRILEIFYHFVCHFSVILALSFFVIPKFYLSLFCHFSAIFLSCFCHFSVICLVIFLSFLNPTCHCSVIFYHFLLVFFIFHLFSLISSLFHVFSLFLFNFFIGFVKLFNGFL